MKKFVVSLLSLFFVLFFAKLWLKLYVEMSIDKIQTHPLVVKPGEILYLNVPNIGAENPIKRTFEIRVPENYTVNKPIPLLVWFSPGGGSSSVSSIPPIVDFSKFLVVALPYPGNKLPRLAIKAGKKQIDSFWEYERPMLEYVKDIIPNISKDVRIAAGFSSGAHLVGSGLDRDWLGFADFFTIYVIHEGGYAPDMTYHGVKSNHKILITYGLQNNSYGKVVVRKMKKAGITPTVKRLAHTGHSMSEEAIDAIRRWIEFTVNG